MESENGKRTPVCSFCLAEITDMSGGHERRFGQVFHTLPSACALELKEVRNRYRQALVMIERIARESQDASPALATLIMGNVRKVLDS